MEMAGFVEGNQEGLKGRTAGYLEHEEERLEKR
jgi:hypothetical protein